MKKRIRRGLTAVLAAVFAVSLGVLIYQQTQYQKNDRAIGDARQLASVPLEGKKAPRRPQSVPAEPEEGAEEQEPDPWGDIDLESLREVNSAVVGWLAIPDTVISYPLIRAADNETYLTHSWDKTPTSAGSIFLDYRVDWDPRGFNTIVYGHNMRNRTMFGSLREYRKDGYWQQHPEIYLIDDGGVHCYEVFAAWEPRVTDIAFQITFTGTEDRQAFIDTALRRSAFRTGVEPTAEDEILTLSTCTGVGHATRWVVQAVLREDG